MNKSGFAKAVALSATTLILSAGFTMPASAAETPNPIDTSSRTSVSEAYKSRWLPTTSGGAGWTGNLETCDKGTQSSESLNKGAQAINFYRGLNGLDSVTFTAAQNEKAQAAALIMEANNTLTHFPTSDMKCFTELGKQGAGTSNLLMNWSIPSMASVVELYMDDPGSNNLDAGHRRWLLNPTTTTMGFGTTNKFNAINVIGGGDSDTRAKPEFMAFPNAGFSPQQLEPNGRWSLSTSSQYIDFTNATVSVKDAAGNNLSVTKNPVHNGYGPNTIVFQVSGIQPASGTATSDYTVTVANISKNGSPITHTYTTRLFDGNEAGSAPAPAPAPSPTPTPTPTPTTNPTFKSTSHLAVTDELGNLWNYKDLKSTPTKIGSSWGAIESLNVTDWDNDGTADMIAKSKSGILYLFKGHPAGGFTRSTIGASGWQNFDIDVYKWKTTDKTPSIIAKHKTTGDIYSYPNVNGVPANPVKIGAKFNNFALEVLDFDKDGNTDILARSVATGNIYLYRMNGSGLFISETRKIVSTGWKDYNSVTTVRNFQGDTTDGLLARDVDGNLFYSSSVPGGFTSPMLVGTGFNGLKISNN